MPGVLGVYQDKHQAKNQEDQADETQGAGENDAAAELGGDDRLRLETIFQFAFLFAIGNHRRNLVLPQALAALQPSGAKMEEDFLKIRFNTAA